MKKVDTHVHTCEVSRCGHVPGAEMAREYGVSAVIYSHCHGESRFGDSIRGVCDGIRYMLVSGDYLGFRPELVIE